MRFRFSIVAGTALAVARLTAVPATAVAHQAGPKIAAAAVNVDVSQRHLNESEEAIAVNPANPNNIVTVTNVGHGDAGLSAGMFEGVSSCAASLDGFSVEAVRRMANMQ